MCLISQNNFWLRRLSQKNYLLSIEDPWITGCDVHIHKSSQWCFCYTEVFNRCKSTAYPPFSFHFPKITVPRERFPSSVRQSNYKIVTLSRSLTLKITWTHAGSHTHSFFSTAALRKEPATSSRHKWTLTPNIFSQGKVFPGSWRDSILTVSDRQLLCISKNFLKKALSLHKKDDCESDHVSQSFFSKTKSIKISCRDFVLQQRWL